MIKLIAIDMDGTLLDSNKQISAEDKRVLQKAARFGIKIVLCTGRPKSGIKPYLDDLDLSDEEYVIGNNGCLTFNSKDWQILKQEQVKEDSLDRLANLLFDFPSLNLVLFTPDANYVIGQQVSKEAKHDAEVEYSKLYHIDLDKFKTLKLPVLVPIFMGQADQLDHFQKRYEKSLAEEFNVVRSLDYAFEMLPKGVSKAKALEHLVKSLNLLPKDVMAIGDANNDLEMLEFAGIAIAMANSNPAVKKLADYQTASNNDSGVAKAILRHALP